MYKVYIKNFMRNGSLITTEEQMLAVPQVNGFPISKPIVKASEDAAENFTFSMESNSPYYDALLQHKTLIRVVYDGPNRTDTDIIFDGKVLNISSSTVYHTKNITCAGYYVFFNDSYYEGKQEKVRTKMTVSQYYTNIINNHNTTLPEKAVTQGTTGVTLPTDQDKYEPTAWTQTSGLLSNLTSNYGGHMLVQSSGNTRTLNWYKYYARDLGDGLRPKVTVGKNILDISADYTGDNVFTRVIPIGGTDHSGRTIYIDGYNGYSGKAMPVTYIRNLYTDQELTDEFHSYTDYRDAETNFGVIYKPVTFSDADTQEKLWNYVKKWIKDSYFGIATSFTVKAIDLHITDSNYPKILIGECVDVTYLIVRNGIAVWETKKLVCKNVSYDLFNPENNSYTFSIPSDLLEHSKTSKKSSQNQQQTASGYSKKKVIDDAPEDPEYTWETIYGMILDRDENHDFEGTAAAASFLDNGEIQGTVRCYDPDDMPNDGSSPTAHMDLWFDAQNVGKITLSGKTVKYVAISSERGIFAYEGRQDGPRVVYWYIKKKGMNYQGSAPGESQFESIAKMIEQDTDTNWGGSTAAASFRANGKISGSVDKAYDYAKGITQQQAAADASLVFSADIVGKFTLSGTLKYVAISKQYGIFGYNASARGIIPATHWYMQAKGVSYDNVSGFIAEAESGEVYATTDGNADTQKTIIFEPSEITGVGSTGKAVFGYDARSYSAYSSSTLYKVGDKFEYNGGIYACIKNLTQAGVSPTNTEYFNAVDRWQIKLNYPIVYTDADGNTRTADGFITARDFQVDEIPSFKTKIGVFDIVIAGKVEATQISADLAEVRKWLGNTISANTYIRTDKLYANRATVDQYYGNYFYIMDEDGEPKANLTSCFSGAEFDPDGGEIHLILKRAHGIKGTDLDIFFNMADTQWYKDQLDSARAAVNIGAIKVSDPGVSANLTLDPGEWAKTQGTYTDQNDQTVTTTSYKYIHASSSIVTNVGIYDSSSNIVSSMTINSPTSFWGGCDKDGSMMWGSEVVITPSGGSASDIKGKNGQTHSGEPSGYSFDTLEDAIASANSSRNGKWVSFQMYIDGNPSDVKTYKVFVNGYGY